jgi:hypothetical protein
MSRITKLLQLRPRDWRLLLNASYLFPLTTLMIRLRGVQGTKEWLDPEKSHQYGITSAEQKVEVRRIARIVNIAAYRGIYRPKCLNRSLVLHHLLRKRGLNSELIMGTRLENGDFSAHAWVESGGVVLNDDPEVRERYSAFDQGVDAKS